MKTLLYSIPWYGERLWDRHCQQEWNERIRNEMVTDDPDEAKWFVCQLDLRVRLVTENLFLRMADHAEEMTPELLSLARHFKKTRTLVLPTDKTNRMEIMSGHYKMRPVNEKPMIANQEVEYKPDLPTGLNHPFIRWPEARYQKQRKRLGWVVVTVLILIGIWLGIHGARAEETIDNTTGYRLYVLCRDQDPRCEQFLEEARTAFLADPIVIYRGGRLYCPKARQYSMDMDELYREIMMYVQPLARHRYASSPNNPDDLLWWTPKELVRMAWVHTGRCGN